MARTGFFTLLRLCLGLLPLVLLAGCAPERKPFATFTMPPQIINNVSDIRNIIIENPRVTVTGNVTHVEDLFRTFIKEKVTGLFYKEQFLRAVEEAEDQKTANVAKTARYYDYIRSARPQKESRYARLTILPQVSITETRGHDLIVTKLQTVPYKVTYKDGVPSSAPDKDAISVRRHNTKVEYTEFLLKGSITFSLKDPLGREIYNRTFEKLEYKKKIGGDTLVAAGRPPISEMASALFLPSLEAMVRDISPYRETRELKLNENGDKRVICLMKAAAYSESSESLAEVIAQAVRKIKGKEKELDGVLQEEKKKLTESVKDPKERELQIARLTAEKDQKVKEFGRFVSPDYENLGILHEVLGDLDLARESYQLAYNADPSNQSAKARIETVQQIKQKVNQLKQTGLSRQNDFSPESPAMKKR